MTESFEVAVALVTGRAEESARATSETDLSVCWVAVDGRAAGPHDRLVGELTASGATAVAADPVVLADERADGPAFRAHGSAAS